MDKIRSRGANVAIVRMGRGKDVHADLEVRPIRVQEKK
jgi:hypothetical protein